MPADSFRPWNYFSNPAGYGNGGKQITTLANGAFQILTTNLTVAPTCGNNWTNGGGATGGAVGFARHGALSFASRRGAVPAAPRGSAATAKNLFS